MVELGNPIFKRRWCGIIVGDICAILFRQSIVLLSIIFWDKTQSLMEWTESNNYAISKTI